MKDRKYLHDFEPYFLDSIPLADGSARLYTRLSREAVTLADFKLARAGLVPSLIQEAVAHAGDFPRVLAISQRGSLAAAELEAFDPYRPCVTVALRPNSATPKPASSISGAYHIEDLGREAFLARAEDLANVMYETVRMAKAKKLIRPECDQDKGVQEYRAELVRYADCLDFDLAWRAFEKRSGRTVGFSMTTSKEDDIGDTLGIGVYALFEADLKPVWDALLSRAQAQLKKRDLAVQITTWEGAADHYRQRDFDDHAVYDTRLVFSKGN